MTFDLLKIYQSDGVTWPGQQKDKDNDKEKHLLTYTVGDSWQSLFLWLEEKNEKKGQKERFQQNLLRESLATYNGVLVWHLDLSLDLIGFSQVSNWDSFQGPSCPASQQTLNTMF